MTFKLKIESSNVGMSDTADVADALRGVILTLDNGGTYGIVRDVNGNTVGDWEITA